MLFGLDIGPNSYYISLTYIKERINILLIYLIYFLLNFLKDVNFIVFF